jgi:hypothetical protein
MAASAWGASTAANTVRPRCYISAWVTTIGATAAPRSVSCVDFGCVSVLRFSARGLMQKETERWNFANKPQSSRTLAGCWKSRAK